MQWDGSQGCPWKHELQIECGPSGRYWLPDLLRTGRKWECRADCREKKGLDFTVAQVFIQSKGRSQEKLSRAWNSVSTR